MNLDLVHVTRDGIFWWWLTSVSFGRALNEKDWILNQNELSFQKEHVKK